MAGVLMGVGEHAGVGFVSAIWATALELAPDGDFSGAVGDAGVLVSGAGGIPPGCSADAGGVVLILQRVGLVATVPTLRVRGLDRYAAAWRKNRKSRGHPSGPAEKTPPKTETKTETEKLKSIAGKKPPAPPRAPKETDPRHRPLVEALVAHCPGYAFSGRDAKSVSALLALGDSGEVVSRWRRALSRSGYPTVRTLPELVTHWNHFATETAPNEKPKPFDVLTQHHETRTVDDF
jgi:hypothetical protein